jgi:putative oxidoreductase
MIYGHGWSKFMRFFGEEAISFRDPFGVGAEISLGLATFAEVFCAGLLVLGLFTRWATIPLIITMAVAAFIAHGDDPFSRQEKALLYMIGYIVILLIGAGRYSLDAWISRRRMV